MKNLAVIALFMIALLTGLGCGPAREQRGLPVAGPSPDGHLEVSAGTTTTAARSSNVTREEAIAIASKPLQPQLVQRARIEATLMGWYWEVVFDELDATEDELKPFPLDYFSVPPSYEEGPFGCSRRVVGDPWTGKTWQAVIVRVNAETGERTGFSMKEKPNQTPSSPMSSCGRPT